MVFAGLSKIFDFEEAQVIRISETVVVPNLSAAAVNEPFCVLPQIC